MNDNLDHSGEGLGLIALGLTILAIIVDFAFGEKVGEADTKHQAIQAGVAHYTVDSKTGETKFEWITPAK